MGGPSIAAAHEHRPKNKNRSVPTKAKKWAGHGPPGPIAFAAYVYRVIITVRKVVKS